MVPPRNNGKYMWHFQFISRLLTSCNIIFVTRLVTNYSIAIITLKNTNSVTRLVTNCDTIIIESIPTLHILKVGHREPRIAREHGLHVQAKLIEKTAAPFTLSLLLHYITPKAPIVCQQLTLSLDNSPYLTSLISLFQIVQPCHIFFIGNHAVAVYKCGFIIHISIALLKCKNTK